MQNRLKVVSYCTTWWSMFPLRPACLLKSLNKVTIEILKLFHRCCHKSCHEDVNTGCRNMSRDSTKRSLSFANLSNQSGRSAVSSPLGVPRLNLVIHSSVRKSSSPFPWFPPQLACPACLESGELGRFYSDISAGGLRPNSSPSNVQLCRAFIKHTPLCILCQPVALGAEVF